MNEALAPIGLFVYNRPDHTKRTIQALTENDLAEDSTLYIFSDGPKSKEDEERVESVRRIVSEANSFKEVNLILRESNWGLAKSIISGVTSLVGDHGKAIIVEDDILTSRYFLKFMNDGLKIYKEFPSVMAISGYTYPLDYRNFNDTYFYFPTTCWGWATWQRAWKYFEKEPMKLKNEFSRGERKRFSLKGHQFWSQVELNIQGEIDSWAVFWYASVFKRNGLFLHSRKSHTRNIGFDSSGKHCGSLSIYDVELSDEPVVYFETDISVREEVISRLNKFNKKLQGGLVRRVARKASRIIKDSLK